jgi:monofunctional biosynthetic peptidoglycan transglycosylase
MTFKTLVVAMFGVTMVSAVAPVSASAQETIMDVLIDFGTSRVGNWTIVNDGVMGGRSASNLELTDAGTAMFSGYLSLDNNGGFASTRAIFDRLDLSGHAGIALKVKGDGRNYQLRIRTTGRFDGVSYSREFATEDGEWTEVFLPFSEFRPTFRGRVPRGMGPLDPSSIRQIGFLLGDKVEGPFQLEISWIGALQGRS